MVTMSDDSLPSAPVNGDADAADDVPGSTVAAPATTASSVAAETRSVAAEDPSRPGLMSSSVDVGGGGVDSDSGGSLSSSASPAPPPITATHDEWNAGNEPSDGADSGVGANGSTPVDGDSLCLSYEGPVTTGSPACVLTPPFVAQHYPAAAVPPGGSVHPSCVAASQAVGADGQPPLVHHSPAISHLPVSEDHLDGCTSATGGSAAGVMSAEAAPAQQYVVNVHVNAGETFSVRAEDRVQLIHGNALLFVSVAIKWRHATNSALTLLVAVRKSIRPVNIE